ncbi:MULTISPECIES: competence protein CoiA [unclassified Granulicatella]|uniref:competence protein CoiA n=1 Tax=unclassified Granulicatella TaxID=2630493 RepID=UPI00107473B0|nr:MULTISPECIES: competence protein CoiA family protein [unclassified Granulicatella]MBF0780437.1 hypothetical protein [Granulicatella sp. 19428wC4_WM01]TFU95426.1 hypothetical protein E4T68_04965 [Granulicatella sp. WM01]
MLVAKTSTNQWCHASQVSREKETCYFCPSCRCKVYLRQGRNRTAHFVHYKKCDQDTFSEGETEEHIQGKLLLYNWLSQCEGSVELEPYLPKLKQRPDLLYTTCTQKIAIEFQCSPITCEKMLERTQGYERAGYKVIWIVGRMHAQKQTSLFLYASPAPYRIYLSVSKRVLYAHSHVIHRVIELQKLFHNIHIQQHTIHYYHRVSSQVSKSFLRRAYVERIPIFSFPIPILTCYAKYPGLKSKFSEVLSVIYFMCQTFQKGDIYLINSHLCKWIDKKVIVLAFMPLVEKEVYLTHLITLCLQILSTLNFVHFKNNHWKFICSLQDI